MMRALLRLALLMAFSITTLTGPYVVHAQSASVLPAPGAMVELSKAYVPLMIKGVKVDPKEPFQFDFIVDTGDTQLSANSPELKEQSNTLIKYFLTALTIPEKDLWVNLSPYEKDRIIPDALGQTEMGRDMLAQDYILKQLTASLIYPEKELGKTFWDKVYSKAQAMYGTSEVPVNTFNKVWIVADKADVYEQGNSALVVGGHLKVMLAEDYWAMNKNTKVPAGPVDKPFPASEPIPVAGGGRYETQKSQNISSQIIKEIIIPELEKEVNEGKNFAPLRQMFYSMILASWYKQALKDTVIAQLYGDKNKVGVGIDSDDPTENVKIYERYVQAYKKGVFNLIKEDIDQHTHKTQLRKYFSGGMKINLGPGRVNRITNTDMVSPSALFSNKALRVVIKLNAKQDDAMANADKSRDLRSWLSQSETDLQETSARLAKKFGVTDATVTNWARILGKNLPSKHGRDPLEPTNDFVRLLVNYPYDRLEIPLRDMAKQHGIASKTATVDFGEANRIRQAKGINSIQPYSKGRPLKDQTKAMIDDMLTGGDAFDMTDQELAEEFGIDRRTVQRNRERMGDSEININLDNAMASNSKRLPKVLKLMAWAKEHKGKEFSFSQKYLARRFGVHQTTVSNILRKGRYNIKTSVGARETDSMKKLKAWAERNRGNEVSISQGELGERYGLDQTRVSKILLDGNYDIKTAVRSKETEATKSLRKFAKQHEGETFNISQQKIADRYGVDQKTVSRIFEEYDIKTIRNKDRAMDTPGGIDLNRNNMQMNISQDKAMGGVDVSVDPAMIERMKQNDFEGFEFNILSITPATLN